MKIFTNKNSIRKMIIVCIFLILFSFAVPMQAQAEGFSAGKLFDPVIDLFRGAGDLVLGTLQMFMVGTERGYGSLMVEVGDRNVERMQQEAENYPSSKRINLKDGEVTGDWVSDFKVPNVLYSPEAIFANKIAALDVNFMNPNKYYDAYGADKESAAKTLQPYVASWYKGFRNIAAVGLLSVLVYIAIRILIGSTSADKAKYKEKIMDWIIALCLLFFLHYIMSFVLVITDEVTKLFASNVTQGIDIDGSDELDKPIKTNFAGYFRYMTQVDDTFDKSLYTILYLCIVVYTCMFTITYLKRFLYMAFFTMIAPLVALTYPIDKITDGKAQAFDLWVKEYVFNALVQPMHLVLYTLLIGNTIDLAADNPIYAMVAMGFLLPAEKFVKKMFGFNKSETAAGLGMVAGGALAMGGMQKIAGLLKGKSGGKGGSGGSGGDAGGDEHVSNPVINSVVDPYAALGGGGNGSSPSGNTTANNAANTGVNAGVNAGAGSNLGGSLTPSGIWLPSSQPTQSATAASSGSLNAGSPSSTETINPSRRAALKNAFAAVGASKARKFQRTFSGPNVRKMGAKALKGSGKLLARGAGAALLGGALAGAGLVAGITSGDLSKAAQYTAAGGLMGAGLGSGVGGAIADKSNNVIGDTVMEAKAGYDDIMLTDIDKKAKQQERYNEQWKLNDKKAKYLESKLGVKGAAEAMKKGGIVDQMLEGNVTDEKIIAKALKNQKNAGLDDKRAIKEAQIASSLDANTFKDPTKVAGFRKELRANGIKDDADRTFENRIREMLS